MNWHQGRYGDLCTVSFDFEDICHFMTVSCCDFLFIVHSVCYAALDGPFAYVGSCLDCGVPGIKITNQWQAPRLTAWTCIPHFNSLSFDQIRGHLCPRFRIDAISCDTWKLAFQHCFLYPSDLPGLMNRFSHWSRNRQDLRFLWLLWGSSPGSSVHHVFRQQFQGVRPEAYPSSVYFGMVLQFLSQDVGQNTELSAQIRTAHVGWNLLMKARRAALFRRDSDCSFLEAAQRFGLDRVFYVREAERELGKGESLGMPRCTCAYHFIMNHVDLSLLVFTILQ